jgi:hypothetical protein
VVNSAPSRTGWNFSAAALAFLLFAVNLAVPLHQVAHGAALADHGHLKFGNEELRLHSADRHGEHPQRDEACAVCQGLTRIVGILPALPFGALELIEPTDALGRPGTFHPVSAGHDFQRGPPQEDCPLIRA